MHSDQLPSSFQVLYNEMSIAVELSFTIAVDHNIHHSSNFGLELTQHLMWPLHIWYVPEVDSGWSLRVAV